MAGSAMVGRHAQICDRHQEIIRIDIGADLAGDGCSIKEHPKCGPESPLEVRGQAVEGRISRMKRRGKTTFCRNERPVSLHPVCQSLEGFVLCSKDRRSVRACVHLSPEDSCDQVGALRKMPIDGADTDPGLFGDLSHGRVYPRVREHCFCRMEQRIQVALRVGAHSPIRALARL